jgi:hypothetical protein
MEACPYRSFLVIRFAEKVQSSESNLPIKAATHLVDDDIRKEFQKVTQPKALLPTYTTSK